MEKGKKPKLQSKDAIKGYLPYVDIKAFEQGIIGNYASTEKVLLCEDGDLLIVGDGSRSGLTGRAIKGVVGSTLYKIYAEGMTTDYLRYFIESKYLLLNTQKKGTGTPHLNANILKKSKLIVPSIEEQERIVAKIEELFSELDNAVETLNATKAKLEVYRQTVLQEAFKGSVHVATLEVCNTITDGDHMPPPKAASGIPFIMISNIDSNEIDWENTNYVGLEYYDQLSDKRKPQKGDVLYTVTGSFGIPVLVNYDRKFCFQRHIALLRPSDKIEPKFLYHALQTVGVYQQAVNGATGTAQKTVGLGVLRKIQIPYFDNLEKQNLVVEKIEQQMTLYNNIKHTVNVALNQSSAMRQSILKQVFEGRLL